MPWQLLARRTGVKLRFLPIVSGDSGLLDLAKLDAPGATATVLLGQLVGTLVAFAGIVIGVSEAFASFLLAPSMKSMFSFALLIAVLLFRPQGLMGRRR